MKKLPKIGACIAVSAVLAAGAYLPAFGATQDTEVYVDTALFAQPNTRFVVVDQAGQPVSGVSIEIWANDALGYQLLGVSQSDGTFDTLIPQESCAYRAHQAGYGTTEGTLKQTASSGVHTETVTLSDEAVPLAGPTSSRNDIVPGDTLSSAPGSLSQPRGTLSVALALTTMVAACASCWVATRMFLKRDAGKFQLRI